VVQRSSHAFISRICKPEPIRSADEDTRESCLTEVYKKAGPRHHTAPRDYEYFYHILSIPRAPPIRWLALVPLSLPPLRSKAITASSSLLQVAPPLDAASILSVSPYKGLCLSLSIRNEGSCSSVKIPRHIHATYTPDRAYPGMWTPGKLNKLVANGRAFPHHLNSYDAYTVVQFLSSL
jgi:hypothetical protein